jgi:hypothetical protein
MLDRTRFLGKAKLKVLAGHGRHFLRRQHRGVQTGLGFRRDLLFRNRLRTFILRILGNGLLDRTRLLGKTKLKVLARHGRHFLRRQRWGVQNGLGFRRDLLFRNRLRTFILRILGNGLPYRTRHFGKAKLKVLAGRERHIKNPQGYSQSYEGKEESSIVIGKLGKE